LIVVSLHSLRNFYALIVAHVHIHHRTVISAAAAPLGQTVPTCLSQPSISAGVGLLYRFDPVRVEVNFAMPLVAARSDGLQRGFQAGVGLEFM
jgi:hypothetical protein